MINTRNYRYAADGRINLELEHPAFGWIPFTLDPSDKGAGFDTKELYEHIVANEQIAPYVPPVVAEPTIEELRAKMVTTPLRMRKALRMMGLLDQVLAYVETLDEESKEAWEWATEYRRMDPFMDTAINTLGTPEQGDELFRLAMSL